MKLFLFCILMCAYCTIGHSQIPYDKQLHIYAGVIIGGTSAAITPTPKKAFLAGTATTFTSAVLKEVYDLSIKKSKFDPIDMTATIVGGTITSYVVSKIRKNRIKDHRCR